MSAKDYFSILIGVIFYFLAIEMLNKILNIQLSDIFSDSVILLVYGFVSTIFLALTIVAGLLIKHKLLKYVYTALLLPIALIFNTSLLLKIIFVIVPIFLLQQDPNKTIKFIKAVPILAVLIYSLFIYLQGIDAIKEYVNTIVIEPSLKYTDTLVEQFITANYYSIAYQQKEIFLKGYDTALQFVYLYATKTNQEEVIDLLRMLNEYRENISKTFDKEIEKNIELYVNQSKSNIIYAVRSLLDKYTIYVFAATILVIYSIVNMYFAIVLILVRIFASLLKIKIEKQ